MATIHPGPSTSIYASVLKQKHTEIIRAVSDYQRELYLGVSIFINFEAFYCRVEDYLQTLLMPWKKTPDFYYSVSAVLMFADSICRIMVRLLFITALAFVAFFCTHVQNLMSNLLKIAS